MGEACVKKYVTGTGISAHYKPLCASLIPDIQRSVIMIYCYDALGSISSYEYELCVMNFGVMRQDKSATWFSEYKIVLLIVNAELKRTLRSSEPATFLHFVKPGRKMSFDKGSSESSAMDYAINLDVSLH